MTEEHLSALLSAAEAKKDDKGWVGASDGRLFTLYVAYGGAGLTVSRVEAMRIDGKFNGKIHSKNELIVGESAHIEGDIHVGRIAISGTVVGKIVADQRVEIHRNGKVYSDIDTPALIIEEGAVFQGNCVMGDKKGNVTNIASKA